MSKKGFFKNRFVREFHLKDIMSMQDLCEDLLNPNIIRPLTIEAKRKIIKKLRKEYKEFDRSMTKKLKTRSATDVIKWFLEYKMIPLEAYNEFFIKFGKLFQEMIYSYAKLEIAKKYVHCEKALEICKKEFL